MCISLIRASISGATINDDVLKITEGLTNNAFDGLFQAIPVVQVDRNNEESGYFNHAYL